MVGKERKSRQRKSTLKGTLPTVPRTASMWPQGLSSEKPHEATVPVDSPFHRWKEKFVPRDANSPILLGCPYVSAKWVLGCLMSQ